MREWIYRERILCISFSASRFETNYTADAKKFVWNFPYQTQPDLSFLRRHVGIVDTWRRQQKKVLSRKKVQIFSPIFFSQTQNFYNSFLTPFPVSCFCQSFSYFIFDGGWEKNVNLRWAKLRKGWNLALTFRTRLDLRIISVTFLLTGISIMVSGIYLDYVLLK